MLFDSENKMTGMQVAEHQALSRRAAEQSNVLLKNESSVLPLTLAPGSVLAVVGPNAERASHLLGGWSLHWQGPASEDEVAGMLSVADAFRALGVDVASATGVEVDGSRAGDDACAAARRATSTVMYAPAKCMGV